MTLQRAAFGHRKAITRSAIFAHVLCSCTASLARAEDGAAGRNPHAAHEAPAQKAPIVSDEPRALAEPNEAPPSGAGEVVSDTDIVPPVPDEPTSVMLAPAQVDATLPLQLQPSQVMPAEDPRSIEAVPAAQAAATSAGQPERQAIAAAPMVVTPTLANASRQRPAQEERTVEIGNRKAHSTRRVLGAAFDVGLPDGVMLGVVVRPSPWVAASFAGGSNAVSPGIRAGLTVRSPTQISPSLAVEAGRYFEGDANGILRLVRGVDYQSSAAASRIGYDFINLHTGIDFGAANSVFFLHGGITYVRTDIHHTNSLINGAVGTDNATHISIADDTPIRAWVPSVKLGFLLYLV